MAEVLLRPATPEDADTVARIWREGWRDGHLGHVPDALVRVRTPESFTARAVDRVGDTTVALVDGEVAGFTMVVGDEVEQVYVSRSHRGSGVAAVLLDNARRAVGAAGHPKAWLAVATGNERARRFYERCGWTDEGAFDYAAAVDSGTTPVHVASLQRQHRGLTWAQTWSGPRAVLSWLDKTERLGGRVAAGNSPARAGDSSPGAASGQPPHMSISQSICRTTSFLVYG